MRLVALELKNIRSYKRARVEFPQGLVLLSGDIGSGKSTILLAIEFALFGLRRGEVTGGSLLRHGSKEGLVSLTIALNGEEITIERSLKRNATAVAQTAGKITKDGVATDLTAVELRSRVLELLNYPDTLLAQTKSLVFRYTVYTPQEQMKSILFEKPDERLDTMRKLFGIDKYKRIRENAALVGRELRASAERLRGQADDLDVLTKERDALKEQERTAKQTGDALAKDLAAKEKILTEQRTILETFETKAQAREQLAKQHAVTQEQLLNARNNLQRTQQEIAALKPESIADISEQKKALQKELQENDHAQQELRKKISENEKNDARIAAMEERIQKDLDDLLILDNCPTCKQPVTETHKELHKNEAAEKLAKITERKRAIHALLETQRKELETVVEKQQAIRRDVEELMRVQARIDAQKQNDLLRKQKQDQERALQEQITTLNQTFAKLTTELEKDFDSKGVAEQRRRTQEAAERHQQARLAQARHAEQTKALAERSEKLRSSIAEKHTALVQANKLSEQHEWLTKHFSNLMFTIEKAVFSTLYHQFNDAFKEWFDALIEEDTITVRLDHDFTPLIEQNGYETLIENLSGGEKTSVALAYRLAINNVINNALQDLRTDGLLILDEPTDGFSHEQLDRVQEVLSKLALEQILVVSHEPKMESFMDHIIRVTKNEHESAVHS